MSVVETPFEKFIRENNEGYVMKCKELGLQNEYTIESNGKPITYTRKRLTARQYTDLEKARAEISKKNEKDPASIQAAEDACLLYLTIGQAYLTNTETGHPITKDEFENMIWEDIKIILDACHLRSMTGVPSAVKASATS